MDKEIRTLLIDDEPLAIEGLKLRLKSFDHINIVGELLCADNAAEEIINKRVELVFLDIQMPGMNGFELIEHLRNKDIMLPNVVFVSAYAEHAVSAFDCQAIDYLLKPISQTRLNQCIDRINRYHASGESAKQIATLSQSIQPKLSYKANKNHADEHITLKTGNEWIRLKIKSILWIEAAGDYMCVHSEQGVHIIRRTLTQLEAELNPFNFIRINRSTLINLFHVTSASPVLFGEYEILLTGNQPLKVSRKYKNKLINFLKSETNANR